MLLQYVVRNFMSIGHEIRFSMLPVEGYEDDRYLTPIETRQGTWQVLRRAIFFGANASGKSCFVKSLDFARDFVVEGIKSNVKIRVRPFKGQFDDLESNSSFQFMIYAQGEIYDYGFTLDADMVSEEWLSILGKDGFESLFERETSIEGNTEVTLYNAFGSKRSKEHKLAEILKSSIGVEQKNQLFLVKLYENNIEKVKPIIEWFKSIQIIEPDTTLSLPELPIINNREFAEFISDKLKQYDTGIEQINVNEKKVNLTNILREYNAPKELIEKVEASEGGIFKINGKTYTVDSEKGETFLYEINNAHILNGQNVGFNMDEESDGTVRLFDLLPLIFDSSKNKKIYIIDELDRSLHVKIVKQFVNDFTKLSDLHSSQLIFTTHDVNLLDLEMLRQDEIWFIEKKISGESKVWTSGDYDINKDYDLIKDYLNGRFGAVPVTKNR